jgi:dolichol-phosphate mannosyltransferase
MLIENRVKFRAMELTIIAPCYNERENINLLAQKLNECLAGIEWELVFVDDDSPDGTAAQVRELAQFNQRVRCIQRIGRSGLASAVIEGMLSSSAPFLAVIDADMQHDERLLPRMLSALNSGNYDIVVGSRYVGGGGIDDWDKQRAFMSSLATKLSRLIVKQDVTDPMSGFFMITRKAFEEAVRGLSGYGFKILLDLFASSPEPLRCKELPYTFKNRQFGESKLDKMVIVEYGLLLLDKMFAGLIPARFFLFGAVGAMGVIVHLVALRASLVTFDFVLAQSLATFTAINFNYYVNNQLTYRDRRLRGRKFWIGLLTFNIVCSIGAIANVGVAANLYREEHSWLYSGIAGTLVGAVWNYAMSATFTWGRKQ